MIRTGGIALTAAGLVFLSACGGPESGVVIGRKYDPGYFYTTTSCMPSGKSTVCVPVQQYMPESWELKLRPAKGKPGWRDVDKGEYSRCINGEHYPECAETK